MVIDFSNNDTWGNTLLNQNKQPMKTAMQELIGIINDNLKNEYTSQEFARLTIFKASAERLLEKEKEQIMKANMDGYKEGCTFHSFGHRPLTTEEYYNQTYNQNK